MPGKQFLCAVLMFFLSSWVWGQSNFIYQNVENTSTNVSFNASPDENQKITNYFISEMARSIPKKTEYTQFVFACKRTDRIYETDPGKFSATFEINDVDCIGDIYYKGFSVADALVPSYCTFTFSVYSDKALPLYRKIETDGKLKIGYNLMASYKFADSSGTKKFNTRVENFAFYYDENSRTRFVSKLKLIDDYFLSDAAIDQCFEKIKAIDYSNIDMIIVYDISLKEVEKTAEELYNKDFPGKLNLVGHDPIQFIDRYNKLSETVFNTRFQLNQKLGNLDKLYYEKGLGELKKNDRTKAEVYFNRSILYNPDFVPSHLELAKIFYANNNLNAAADKLSHILHNLNPTPDIYKQVVIYTDTVYNKMLETGNDYNKTEKFNEAIDIFEKCVNFCKELPGYICSGEHVKGLALARFGIYQSYLTVSQKAIDNGRPELAEIYISDARNYQKLYNHFIINDAEAVSKLDRIKSVYLSKGDTLISKGKYEKGLSYLEKAKTIADKNQLSLPEKLEKNIAKAHNGIYNSTLINCRKQLGSGLAADAEKTLNAAVDYQQQHLDIIAPSPAIDSLLTKIKFIQYNEMISSGIYSLKIPDDRNALDFFAHARQIGLQYPFGKNARLDSLIKATAKPVITDQIGQCRKILASGNTDTALSMAGRIERNIAIYGLGSDTLLFTKFRELKKNIADALCHKAQEVYTDFMNQAGKAVSQEQYIASDTLYYKAIKVTEDFPECHIDPNEAINGKKAFLLGCNYQKMMNNASSALLQYNYNSYFYLYSEAENFYQTMQIKTYGLTHQLLTDKISLSEDTAFIITGCGYMLQKNRPEDALQCLRTLVKINYPQSGTKNTQLQAGALMARKDHDVNATAKPSVILLSYTGNNKWFAFFKSAYIMTWKSLNKRPSLVGK